MKSTSPFTQKNDGTVTWTHLPGDRYIATGVDIHGKRLRPIKSDNWRYIVGINLHRGTKWLERNGKRYVIQRVWN